MEKINKWLTLVDYLNWDKWLSMRCFKERQLAFKLHCQKPSRDTADVCMYFKLIFFFVFVNLQIYKLFKTKYFWKFYSILK